jgi:PEP-CTERM motif
MKVSRTQLLAAFAIFALSAGLSVPPASADSITFGGAITQSTQDGTGPAVNNTALNAIMDGDAFSILLDFTGSITAPGTFALSGVTMVFSDPTAPVVESAFSTVSLTVTPSGEISLLGCLTTGSGCEQSNQLTLDFMIPLADLNLQNVAAQSIFGLTPLDLLEDDGITDIHGTVTSYSYTGQGTKTPEPGTLALLGLGMLAVAWNRFRRAGAAIQ